MDGQPQLAVGDPLEGSERLLRVFSRTSAIGFAILDSELRYQAINACLAAINNIPPKAHLGFSTRELFGEISRQAAEPNYDRVLACGETTCFEVKNAVLPTRTGSRYWGVNTNFPIRDRRGRVRQIGIIVVEVTQQRRLEILSHKLAAALRHSKNPENFWLARELQDSIDEYDQAVESNLQLLIDDFQKPATSEERLGLSILKLDQRLMNIRKLVSEAASHLQIQY